MLHHILVFDDDANRFHLAAEGWSKYGGCLKTISTSQQAADNLQEKEYSLIIIVADFVKEQLLPTVGQIRRLSDVPILVFTSHYIGNEKIAFIHAGTDEYLPFPQTLEESIINGVALIRRNDTTAFRREWKKSFVCGDLELDIHKRLLYVAGEPFKLTRGEFYCLELLISHPGKVFDIENIYNYSFRGAAVADDIDNSVRALIRRIRSKIHPDQMKYIETVRGMGYCIHDGSER